MGKGKAKEVPVAVTKAMESARRNMRNQRSAGRRYCWSVFYEKETFTASLSTSLFTSNICAGAKLNIPAMMLLGNISRLLL